MPSFCCARPLRHRILITLPFKRMGHCLIDVALISHRVRSAKDRYSSPAVFKAQRTRTEVMALLVRSF